MAPIAANGVEGDIFCAVCGAPRNFVETIEDMHAQHTRLYDRFLKLEKAVEMIGELDNSKIRTWKDIQEHLTKIQELVKSA